MLQVNVAGVADYASTGEQVTSITQFSDVYPTDWAHQALSKLIERYGCVAGYPNGTYRGNGIADGRMNACLDRVTEVTDELKRLMKEFEKELAIVKGRVDGLEARGRAGNPVLHHHQAEGKVDFVMGGVSWPGEDYDLGEGRTGADARSTTAPR